MSSDALLVDPAALLDSWELHLTAERKTPRTIKTYTTGVRVWLAWCESTGTPTALDRARIQRWTASMLEAGLEATTVRSRQQGVRRFAAWLLEEGELTADPLAGLKPPRLDTKVVQPLTEAQLGDLLGACRGAGFWERRDEALIRLMVETGARAEEVVSMNVDDVDLKSGMAVVRRGKGGKGRRVPFGPQTARAIDRYLRKRREHRLVDTPRLWLGERGRNLSYAGLYRTLKHRAKLAGIAKIHPHLLRHTAASRWLAAGGSEGGLMAVAGWSQRSMLDRYTRATAEDRAADEARGLNLGDL